MILRKITDLRSFVEFNETIDLMLIMGYSQFISGLFELCSNGDIQVSEESHLDLFLELDENGDVQQKDII